MATRTAKSLFELLSVFERRSMAHDASGASQRDRDNTWDGVVFRLGPHRLTVSINEVEEILPLPQTTPVPGATDWLLGLANVRGNLVSIVDLGWFLFGSRTPITARTRMLLTRLQGRYLGLIVDEVYGQRHFNINDTVEETLDSDSLGDRIERIYRQGDERWARFRMDQLLVDVKFLDGAA